MMPEQFNPVSFSRERQILLGFSQHILRVNHRELGQALRTLREGRKISLRKVAIRCKISVPYLSDLELGRRNWSEKRLASYLESIGVAKSAYISVLGNISFSMAKIEVLE
jgi:transcriptional regulator with XRE-family HTH domain